MKYSKKEIENAVKNAFTQNQALINLGLRAAGNNFKTLKKYIKEYSIDVSHFNPDKVRIEKLKLNGGLKKIPLSRILIENSTYSNGKNLKEKLYKEGLKEKKCELCGQGDIWQGKKMSLIIDHINGIHNDNRIENLRIICPNCDSTLDTYCGRNIKKNTINTKEICPVCNEKKHKDSKMCRKCTVESRKNGTERPLIGQLKKDIEVFGIDDAAIKYGVSVKEIERWFKTYNETNKHNCPGCGEKIWLSAKMCSICSNIKKRKCERPSYEILRNEIKEMGYEGVGKKYGVIGRTVRRWIDYCEKNKEV